MKTEEGVLKHFALDRIQSLAITDEYFTIEPTFNAIDYYTHFFGIWCDQSLTPQDIIISATPEQAHYFRTLPLPLHHSQKELSPISHPNGSQECRFMLHMCITPDFEMEMLKYTETTTWEVKK